MENLAESDCFRSRSNTWPKNLGLDTNQKSSIDLIEKSIEASPEKRLALSDIYQWLADNVPHFKDKTVSPLSWKNSVRHNLSLHGKFLRVQVDRKSMWTINPNPGEANGRRKLHRGGKRSRRQTTCEHSYCHNTTSHYMKEELVCQPQMSTSSRNTPEEYQELESIVGSYSPPVDLPTQGTKCLQSYMPSQMSYQQLQIRPTQPTEYIYPANTKQEFTNPDCNFRTRSYSSSSSVSRSSLASSVDEATANVDWVGSRQTTASVAAYFSSFTPKPDATQEQRRNLFAEAGQHFRQLPTNLRNGIEPESMTATYNYSDDSVRFRQRSYSYSNEKHSTVGVSKSRPTIYSNGAPCTRNLVENRGSSQLGLLPNCKKMSQLASASNMADMYVTSSTRLGEGSLRTPSGRSGASGIRSSVYHSNFVNETANRTIRSPGSYIQHDPKSIHLLEDSEPYRQRSYSNPNARFRTRSPQYENASKSDRTSSLTIMQEFRSRTNSNPKAKSTACHEERNINSALTEAMSPMMERLRFDSSDQIECSDLSNIKLQPLNFQENLDIENIIKLELSIDGILDFS
nr:unnamed protein product [Callosobruchus chinensis]